MAKVIRINRKKYTAVTLSEAMQDAIDALGGKAHRKDVVAWISRHYAHREWSPISMSNYFYVYSRGQKFVHVAHGVYGNYGRVRKKTAA